MPTARRSHSFSKRLSRPSEPKVEPTPLLDLYKIAVDEYRFQVNLNWSRTQYHIVLNLGILGLATGLLRLDDQQVSTAIGPGLYIAGIVCCSLSLVAGRVQQDYYQQTKAHKAKLEALLELGDLAIQTTPGMGNATRRIAKVTTFHNAMLFIVLTLDVLGLGYTFGRILGPV